MLKSQRTNRKPILPVNAEFIGTKYEGLETLHDLATKTSLLRIDLSDLRSAGYELDGPVANGIATFVHPIVGTIQWNGLGNTFDGEPDLVHLIAAFTEYTIWLEYLDVKGWSITTVTDGVFNWITPQASTISTTPVAHDLWEFETDDRSSVVNMITLPS